MSVYVTDTHALVWFGNGKLNQLSKAGSKAFIDAENGEAFIHVPSMVIYEIAILQKLGRIKLSTGFRRWTEILFKNPGFGSYPLDADVIDRAIGYNFNSDPFDRVIAATAVELSVPLITRDAAITGSGIVEVVW